YGRIYAAVAGAGRKPRRARVVDLLIAAIASSNQMPLYTRNPDDFEPLQGVIDISVVKGL
ncbi:MAG TPA: VapC toxin family PIN domain ribonuclease, partial [Acidimicrobiia bacterium]|nr:VapC toxin family PIN domain ribonuclease [Acidimicrobiia bacterium]